MKKTSLQTKKEKELKRLKKEASESKKAKIKFANATLEFLALNEAKNKERRNIYNRYKEPLKKALSEVEYWKNKLVK